MMTRKVITDGGETLTPRPETTAVALECGHKTREMGAGRDEVWPGAGTYEEDARPRTSISKGTEEEAGSGNEERVGNQPDRKTNWSVIRHDRKTTRKKILLLGQLE